MTLVESFVFKLDQMKAASSKKKKWENLGYQVEIWKNFENSTIEVKVYTDDEDWF